MEKDEKTPDRKQLEKISSDREVFHSYFSNLYKAHENALVYFLDGEEKNKVAKESLAPLAWAISLHMTTLYETENLPVYLRKVEKIIDMLLEDETETDFIKSIYEKIRKQIASL